MLRSVQFCLLAAAAALSLGAQAKGEPPGLKGNQAQAQPQAISTSHKLQKTYFDTNNENGLALGAGSFTTVGAQIGDDGGPVLLGAFHHGMEFGAAHRGVVGGHGGCLPWILLGRECGRAGRRST